MSLFGLNRASDRYGVIIDIGSGSVLTAIVHSDSKLNRPKVIWSYREHAPLRNIDSLEQSAKAVMAALINSSMLLDSEGRKALSAYNKKAELTDLQCGISAPWSYTVTKSLNYQQPESFKVTKELIFDLIRNIQEKIENDLKDNESLQDLGLEIIARTTLGLTANGYRVRDPEGQKAKELLISHTSVVAQQYLVEAIDEMHEKLFTKTKCRKLSFILMLYTIAKDLQPQTNDVCLVDVTYEATEIGVVRDGILTYSTHTPFGVFSLAREISAITKVPLAEAFGYLHTEKPYSFIDNLSKSQKTEIEELFESYIEKVSDLFRETGDSLSIPKQIFLHTEIKSESLFIDLIEKAAKRSIKSNPDIYPFSTELQRKIAPVTNQKSISEAIITTDSALLISAQFFHKQLKKQTFDYF